MERLLEDAEKLSGIHYEIGNYADMIEAIHVIQTEMGITGTTAKEASETIEGSANAAKAAWQNLLTAFGREDADIDKQVDELTDSVETLAKNVIPVAERAFVSLTKTALREGIELSKQLPDLADKAMEHIHQTIAKEFGGAADNIFAVETAVKAAASAFIAYKGAMVVSDAVEGVIALSNVIKGATTAQEALNAAGMANPFVLIATAVAGATVALKSYIDTQADLIDVAGDTYNNLTDEQQAFIDSSNELAGSINNDIKAAKGNIESVNAEVGALQNMTDELYAINDAEELTNEQKSKMKTLVDSLNKSLPSLNLQLDEETGHLINQREEVDALIESYSKQAKAQAAQESMVQLYKEQFEAEQNLKKSEKERADARQKYDQLLWKSYQIESEYNRLKEAAEDTTRGLSVEEQKRYEELGHQLHDVNEQIREQKNSVGDLDGAFITSNESVNNVNAALEEFKEITAESAEAPEALADSTEKAAQKIAASSTAQGKTMRALSQELKDYVVYVGGETYNISEDTFQKMQELSDQYNEALKSQEDNIRGSIDLFSEFNGGVETSSQELINNLWDNAAELDTWAENLASLADRGINQGLLNELEAAGPSSANKVKAMTKMSDTELQNYSDKWVETQGRIHQIAADQTDDVLKENENLMGKLIGAGQGNKSNMEQVYSDLGNAITGGLGDNVRDGTNKYVVPVTQDMVQSMVIKTNEELNNANFNEKGDNIPHGLAIGIENGEHWAIDAMHKMIDDVQKTYMEDTQTHSPSKLFADLAEYIPEGMALGISNGKDNVTNAMNDILSAVEDSLTVFNDNINGGLVPFDPISGDGGLSVEKNLGGLVKLDPSDRSSGIVILSPSNKDGIFEFKNSSSPTVKTSPQKPSTPSRTKKTSRSSSTSIGEVTNINLVLPDMSVIAKGTAPYLDVINGKLVYLQNMGLST